jgi:hypothetical protein
VDIFHKYPELEYDGHTEMQLNFQDSRNPSLFVSTPKEEVTGLTLSAANYAVKIQQF